MMRYNNFSSYLRRTYGENVEKICLDGGFTCPNRDGTKGVGGCIYCGARGAGDHIGGKVDITAQVDAFFRARPKARRAIAYFQNFTGTYAPIDRLRTLYTDAIRDERVVALAIATRPDCIDEGVVELLASLKHRVDVWVELGLQTCSDETAERIHRAYPTSDFERAYHLLYSYGIGVVAHVMIGLPGEGRVEFDATIDYLNRFSLFGIKLHSVYIMRDTLLQKMYEGGQYTPLTRDEYITELIHALCRLPPDLTVHRLTGDCPRDALVAPAWNLDKDLVFSLIRDRMQREDLTQGCLYQKQISTK